MPARIGTAVMLRLAAILDSPETLYRPTRRIAMLVSDRVACQVRSTDSGERGSDPQHIVTMHDNRITGRPSRLPSAWSRQTPYGSPRSIESTPRN